jgi:uncharacterized protein YjbI with pentapeptide repeats
LRGVHFSQDDLSGWNFSGQNLTGASFTLCDLTNANLGGANFQSANLTDATLNGAKLSGVDFRHAQRASLGFIGRNIINIDGQLYSLELATDDVLVLRDDDGYTGPNMGIKEEPHPVRVLQQMAVSPGGTLTMLLEADSWDSTISFQPGIPVELSGSLELAFAAGVDVSRQIGRTFDLFDWTGVEPIGQFEVVSDYAWDTNNLYTTGEVTLIPEPATWALAACALLCLALVYRAHLQW